jgi:hypothetical protein
LRVLIETSGIDAGDKQAPRSDGLRLTEDWAGGLSVLEGLRGASCIPRQLQRLRSIGDPDDPILEELVAHEQAIDALRRSSSRVEAGTPRCSALISALRPAQV